MENSKIGWTTHTFNFWEGCTKACLECANCYAEGRNLRFAGGENWGKGAPRRRTSPATANAPLKWNREAAAGKRRDLVFTMSLGDWADPEVPDAWRDEMFEGIITKCPSLVFQLLTKRPAYAASYLKSRKWNLNNVWLGGSIGVENLTDLLTVPAPIHFVSVEPYIRRNPLPKGFQWYIFGGESGAKARPCNLDDMLADIEATAMTGAKVFVKQLGSKPVRQLPPTRGMFPLNLRHPKGEDMSEWPKAFRIQEIPQH